MRSTITYYKVFPVCILKTQYLNLVMPTDIKGRIVPIEEIHRQSHVAEDSFRVVDKTLIIHPTIIHHDGVGIKDDRAGQFYVLVFVAQEKDTKKIASVLVNSGIQPWVTLENHFNLSSK